VNNTRQKYQRRERDFTLHKASTFQRNWWTRLASNKRLLVYNLVLSSENILVINQYYEIHTPCLKRAASKNQSKLYQIIVLFLHIVKQSRMKRPFEDGDVLLSSAKLSSVTEHRDTC